MSVTKFSIFQERIRVGKELLEAKRIEEDNERKRFIFKSLICAFSIILFAIFNLTLIGSLFFLFVNFLLSQFNGPAES